MGLTASAAWMVVPSMPTSPSFWPFLLGCSTNALGVTFLAKMCALQQSQMIAFRLQGQKWKPPDPADRASALRLDAPMLLCGRSAFSKSSSILPESLHGEGMRNSPPDVVLPVQAQADLLQDVEDLLCLCHGAKGLLQGTQGASELTICIKC